MSIIDDLRASDIAAFVTWNSRGLHVRLGDRLNTVAEGWRLRDWAAAEAWLIREACAHFPDSDFAAKHGRRAA